MAGHDEESRAGMKKWTRTRGARWGRIAGLGVGVACLGVIIATKGRGLEVLAFDRASLAVGSGCVAVGYRTELPTPFAGAGDRKLGPLRIYRNEYFLWDLFGSWRPVHKAPLRIMGGGPISRHHIVVPLWQPLVVAVGVAGLCHGFLAGVRRGDPTKCVSCGYSLVGVRREAGVVACPECGRTVGEQWVGC